MKVFYLIIFYFFLSCSSDLTNYNADSKHYGSDLFICPYEKDYSPIAFGSLSIYSGSCIDSLSGEQDLFDLVYTTNLDYNYTINNEYYNLFNAYYIDTDYIMDFDLPSIYYFKIYSSLLKKTTIRKLYIQKGCSYDIYCD
jgi:hypothetical protein